MRLMHIPSGIGAWVIFISLKNGGVSQMKNAYRLPTEEVLQQLETTPAGLSSTEAAKRQETYGPNKLKEAEKATWVQRFMAQL